MTRMRPTNLLRRNASSTHACPKLFLLTVTTGMDLRGVFLQGHRLIRAFHVTSQCIKNGATKGPKVRNLGSSVETFEHGSFQVIRCHLLAGNVPNYTVPPGALVPHHSLHVPLVFSAACSAHPRLLTSDSSTLISNVDGAGVKVSGKDR